MRRRAMTPVKPEVSDLNYDGAERCSDGYKFETVVNLSNHLGGNMSSATKRGTDTRLRELLVQDSLVRDLICRRAYEIYQSRGEQHGHDREDWLQAETEILDVLVGQGPSATLEVPLLDFGQNFPPNFLPDFPRDQLDQALQRDNPFPAPDVSATVELTATSETVWRSSVADHSAGSVAVHYEKPPKKKADKAGKSHSGRKHKKSAEVALADTGLITANEASGKKAGHKSKAGKKKDKKTETGVKGKRSAKASD